MSRRHYSSSAASTTLTSSISNVDTSLPVASITGLPVSYPFTLILDGDTASEEVVEVTGGSGLNLTATRGVDGTTALAHTTGAVVRHGVSARDFDEPNAHIAEVVNAHGLTLANVPRGTLGYAAVTANQGGITTTTDLTGLSVAVTVGSSRRVRITAITPQVLSDVAGDVVGLVIAEGGTQLSAGFATMSLAGLNSQGIFAQVVITPTAGPHTYKLRMVRAAGSGTVTMTAGSTAPAFIHVEDVGS